MNISDYDYELPEGRIARFPVAERDASRLLVWRDGKSKRGDKGRDDNRDERCYCNKGGRNNGDNTAATPPISETVFGRIGEVLPAGSLLVFNNTRVVRARLVMHKPAPTAGAATPGATAIGSTTPESPPVIGTPTPANLTPGTPTLGARVEILCLEPADPADYERAFAARGHCEWSCMVGNLKKWKSGPVEIPYVYKSSEHTLRAWRVSGNSSESIGESIGESSGESNSSESISNSIGAGGSNSISNNSGTGGGEQIVRFTWDADLTFGELLELLGRIPIPPYLGRDSETIDNTRYQTVYARTDGSVAAPTAGLHFTPELIGRLRAGGVETDEVTLHVGAGTFLPVKTENALEHPMHTEHFEVTLATIEHLLVAMERGPVIAVGTTSVRTLESLAALAWRIKQTADPDHPEKGGPETEKPVGQFEPYDIPVEFDGRTALGTLAAYMHARGLEKLAASTRIMITPARFRFRIVRGIVTNFHQPKSTLLLLISAFVGNDNWRRIYDYALSHDFRFLSYGDSSLLLHG